MKTAGIIPQHKSYKIKKIHSLLKTGNVSVKTLSFNDVKSSEVDFFISAGIPNIKSNPEYIESFKIAQSRKIPILIVETAVIRSLPNINNWTRLCFDNISMDEGKHPIDLSVDRWSTISKKYNLQLKDWHCKDNVLVNLQIPTDAALNKLNFFKNNYIDYIIEIIEKIKNQTDRTIIIRPHPLDKITPIIIQKKFKDLHFSSNSLSEDLENSKVMITYNSTSSIESIINGTPVISLDPSCIAWEVSGHSIEDIETELFFDRSTWLNKISFMQWEAGELSNPYVWELLKFTVEKEYEKRHISQ